MDAEKLLFNALSFIFERCYDVEDYVHALKAIGMTREQAKEDVTENCGIPEVDAEFLVHSVFDKVL